MSATGYKVWKALFPKEETLHTRIKQNPFRLLDVATEGIKLSIPRTNAKDRLLTLDYPHLDALWELRDSVDENDLNHTVNDVWKNRALKTDSTNESQYWALVCARNRRELDSLSVALSDVEADQTEPDNSAYSPQAGDLRQVVERQIRERRGQQHFRDLLRKRHGDRCLVTGCTALAVIEAAHIKPYQGEKDNHPDNGLLLRSDIHTLFDLNLLGIEPERLQVEVHLSIAKEYGYLAGKVLDYAPAHPPSDKALRLRYGEFLQRLKMQSPLT